MSLEEAGRIRQRMPLYRGCKASTVLLRVELVDVQRMTAAKQLAKSQMVSLQLGAHPLQTPLARS